MRVLIADDDAGLREILKIFMARMGHVAIAAENGANALSQLDKSPYDILITDGDMPEMTGFELCRVVKDRFPHIFMIGLTGSSRLSDFEKAGAHTRYQKPVQFIELQLAIENHFGTGRGSGLGVACPSQD